MLYAVIITSLGGVIGLLYGLLERSKRQAADSKADALSKSLLDQINENISDRDRLNGLVKEKQAEIDRLNGELDVLTKNSADIARRLNDLLASGVQAQSASADQGRTLPAVPAADLTTGGSG
jgi:hypothetical protein